MLRMPSPLGTPSTCSARWERASSLPFSRTRRACARRPALGPEIAEESVPEFRLPNDECGVPHPGRWFWKRLLGSVKLGAKARMRLVTMVGAGDDGVVIVRKDPDSASVPDQTKPDSVNVRGVGNAWTP
jgi:hypothetical protein